MIINSYADTPSKRTPPKGKGMTHNKFYLQYLLLLDLMIIGCEKPNHFDQTPSKWEVSYIFDFKLIKDTIFGVPNILNGTHESTLQFYSKSCNPAPCENPVSQQYSNHFSTYIRKLE